MNSKVGLIFSTSSQLEFSKVLLRVGLCRSGTGGGVFATTPLIFSTSRLTRPPGTTTTENLPQPDHLSLFYVSWKQNWVVLGVLILRYLFGSKLPSSQLYIGGDYPANFQISICCSGGPLFNLDEQRPKRLIFCHNAARLKTVGEEMKFLPMEGFLGCLYPITIL